MKTRIMFFIGLLNACLFAMSMPISESEAEGIALRFVQGNSPRFAKSMQSGGAVNVSLAYTSPRNELRVFNVSSKGFVVVAGDDCVETVLGYSDEGEFVYSELPENARWWLEELANSISLLAAQNEVQHAKANVVANKAIKPLLQSKWGQGAPFNNNCPTYTKNGVTSHAVTGCVATAMAQVMRYHQWPTKGTGSHSYNFAMNNDSTDMRQLSSQFSSHTYNWSQMPHETNSCTSTQQSQLAQLLLDCGVSANMTYGSSSATSSQFVIPAMTSHFGYDGGIKVFHRNCFSLTSWKVKIFEELTNNRPVIYAGQGTSGGHAFVIDGCDTNDYYHINWGWNGKSNGYFLFTELNPKLLGTGGGSGGYNYDQRIFTGIRRDAGSSSALSIYASTFTSAAATKSVSSSHVISLRDVVGVAANNYTANFYVCLTIYNSSGAVVKRVNKQLFSTEPDYQYNWNFNFTPTTSLADGIYFIRPQYTVNNSTYTVVPLFLSSSQYIKMTIANGYATYSLPSTTPSLKATEINISGTPYVGRKAQITATITNSGAYYSGNIYAAWANTAINTSPVAVNLANGESQQVEFIIDGPSYSGSRGMYFYDNDKNEISGYRSFVVQPAQADPNLSISSQIKVGSSVMPPENVTASASISNSGGVFTGKIEAFILPYDSGTILSMASTPFLTIPTGTTTTISFSTPFENGIEGSKYRWVLRDPTVTSSYTIWGSFAIFTLGASPSCDVNGDGQVTVADVTAIFDILNGVSTAYLSSADTNGDGEVTVGDVTKIYGVILGLE